MTTSVHHPLALGVMRILLLSLRDHKQRHYGAEPRGWVIDPAVYADLLRELDAQFCSGVQMHSLAGVPIQVGRTVYGILVEDCNGRITPI